MDISRKGVISMKRKYILCLVLVLAILYLVTGDSKKVNAASEDTEQLSQKGYVFEGEDTIVLNDWRGEEDNSDTLEKFKKVKNIKINQESTYLYGMYLVYFENAETLTIPSNIDYIDYQVTMSLPKLKQFIVDKDNAIYSSVDGVLYNKSKTKLVAYPYGASLDVKIKKGTTIIGDYAFYQAPIKSITFEEGLYAIMNQAFAGTKITSISLPASFRLLYNNAFLDSFLETIDISSDNTSLCSVDGVVYNKNKTFLYYWPDAKKEELLKFPETLRYLDCDKILNFSDAKTISIPTGLTAIVHTEGNQIERILIDSNHKYFKLYDGALYSNNYQRIRMYPNRNEDTEIDLHNDLTILPMDLFYTENTTKVLTLPSKLCELKGKREANQVLLSGFSHLQELKLSSSNKNFKLVDGVLYNANQTKLLWYPIDLPQSNFIIPKSVTLVDNDQLVIQNWIEKITVPNKCNLYDLDELNTSEYQFQYANPIGSECPLLQKMIINRDNPYYCSVNGVLFSKDMKKLLLYPAQKKDQNYSVPEGITDAWFLNENNYLVTLSLPKSLTHFNTISFYESVGDIYGDSLLRYSALTEINVDKDNQDFKSVDGVLIRESSYMPKTLVVYPMGKQSIDYELEVDYITNTKYFTKHPYLKAILIDPKSEIFSISDGKLRYYYEDCVRELDLGKIELKYKEN